MTTFKSAIEEITKPQAVLATIFLKRLRDKGLRSTRADLKRVTASFKKAMETNSGLIELPISNRRLERANISTVVVQQLLQDLLSDDDHDIKDYLARIEAAAPEAAMRTARELGKKYVEYVLLEGEGILQEHHTIYAQFEANLHAVWGGAFDLLEIIVHTSREIAAAIDKHWLREKRKRRSLKISLMHRLMARACRVAQEIVVLLRSGLASGAHARWRSLHEIAVVARLLAVDDKDMAERYVAHRAVTKYQSTLAYETHAERLGLRPVSAKVIARNKKVRDQAIQRYGEGFEAPYGWASAALGRAARKFDDIEKLAGFDAFRPYYKYASQAIHASTQGTLEAEGLPVGNTVLLSGPSNYGLADPGQLTAHSLVAVFRALFVVQPSVEATSFADVLRGLAEECAKRFNEAHRVVARFVKKDIHEERQRKDRALARRRAKSALDVSAPSV